MVGITVKGRSREMCLLLVLMIIGPGGCVGFLSFENHYTSHSSSVQFSVNFVLYYARTWMIFTKKPLFYAILAFFMRSHTKSCVIFFWGLSFPHKSKPGCAIFLRYFKYYTNAGSVRRLVHDAGIQPLSFHDIALKWSFMSIDKRLVQRYILNIKREADERLLTECLEVITPSHYRGLGRSFYFP